MLIVKVNIKVSAPWHEIKHLNKTTCKNSNGFVHLFYIYYLPEIMTYIKQINREYCPRCKLIFCEAAVIVEDK